MSGRELVKLRLAPGHGQHRHAPAGQPRHHGLPDRPGGPDHNSRAFRWLAHVPLRSAVAARRAATSSARATSAGTPPMPHPSGGNWVM
jgi:hypothetical protein